jgi:Diacylglycerol acyltransferase
MTNGCGMFDQVHNGDRRDLCASVLFFIPVFREMLIFVGGEKEQLMTTPGEHKIYLLHRKGFVKLALEYGIPLVPMYAFGENECYHVSKLFMGLREWLQATFQLGVPLVWGRWCSMVPLQVKIHIEVGKPLKVTKKRKEDITQVNDRQTEGPCWSDYCVYHVAKKVLNISLLSCSFRQTLTACTRLSSTACNSSSKGNDIHLLTHSL